ncbi:PEP-CTERM sorting domain-containing protein [Kiritimatiellaeota bacterium B1221]|nr:PEP-CTERM sorting domain-containing protein [Kiritimatiellaeota bacterium B1221]
MKSTLFKSTALTLVGLVASIASAATINFSSYADGEIVGQDGWGGDTGFFTVAGGAVDQVAGGWDKGVDRTFSAGEVGEVFNPASSIIEYSFTFDPGTKVAGQYTGMSFSIGEDYTEPGKSELTLHIVPVGLFKIIDDVKTGNDEYFDGFAGSDQWAENTDVTVTLTVDYGAQTYTATRSDLPGSTRSDFSFDPATGGNGAYYVRFSATQLQSAPSIKSMSITAIPEPSSVLLLMVAGGALLFFRRKK